MTVLRKKAASGIEGRKLREYAAVGLLAGAIGVVSTLGINSLTGTDTTGPAEIEQARAAAFADHLETQWFTARLAEIQQQRAADMVKHYSNLYSRRLSEINEQRARDMVEFKYGADR